MDQATREVAATYILGLWQKYYNPEPPLASLADHAFETIKRQIDDLTKTRLKHLQCVKEKQLQEARELSREFAVVASEIYQYVARWVNVPGYAPVADFNGETPVLSDIVREIADLEKEFTEIGFTGNNLWVVTKPVTLEFEGTKLYFGKYRITFHTQYFTKNHSNEYRFQAKSLETRPLAPRADPRRQHPHIIDTGLICMGEITAAMTKAMQELRLYDCFTMIGSLLHNWEREGHRGHMKYFYDEHVLRENEAKEMIERESREKEITAKRKQFAQALETAFGSKRLSKIDDPEEVFIKNG